MENPFSKNIKPFSHKSYNKLIRTLQHKGINFTSNFAINVIPIEINKFIWWNMTYIV